MTQGVLPFKYESEKKTTGMTALGKALIPVANAHLRGFEAINKELVAFSSRQQSAVM